MTEKESLRNFDEDDLELLMRIEQNFDASLEELAGELGLSKSAVHYRLNKHRENGTIQNMTADLDPIAFGLSMMVVTDVSVSHESGYAEDIGEKLSAVPGVEQVYYTMGDIDFVVISRTQNREQMNDLIDGIVSIEGVNETSSKFVMKELKTHNKSLDNLSSDMRRRIISDTS